MYVYVVLYSDNGGIQGEEEVQLVVVHYVSDVSGNCHALAVEGVLNAHEKFDELADCQNRRLGHGCSPLRVQVESSPHQVTEVIGE